MNFLSENICMITDSFQIEEPTHGRSLLVFIQSLRSLAGNPFLR